MTPLPDDHRLLDDVLGEAVPDDLRSTSLGETLQLARGRRVMRRVRRASVAAAVLVALGIFTWRNVRAPSAEFGTPTIASAPNCEIVRTQSLSANALVSTRYLDPVAVVTSNPADAVVVVHTMRSGDVRLINDEELLALAAPHRPALVRIDPQRQQLIFLDAVEVEPLN